MRQEFTEAYSQLYRRHWWFKARERVLFAELEALSKERTIDRILDVGCGEGLLFDQLKRFGSTIEGVDPNVEVQAEHMGSDRIHHADFVADFESSRSYDLILMLDVLEHLEDDVAALTKARGLLKRHGLILITVPAFEALWTGHDEVNEHCRRYSRLHLRSVLTQAGLEEIQTRFFFHWLFFVKLGIRGKEMIFGSRPDHIPRVPPWPLNKLFYNLTMLEQLVAGQVDLPFGSSLISVARRGCKCQVPWA